MCEMHLGLVAFRRDLKDKGCSFPFALVFRETEVVVQNAPNYFTVRNTFDQLQGATMHVFVLNDAIMSFPF
jgi:hypothetical protein